MFDALLGFIEHLVLLLKDFLAYLIKLAGKAAVFAYDKFLSLNIAERVIVLTLIPAMFAAVLPVARFKIFDSYFPVNNPLAVYMIGVAFFMIGTVFFRGAYVFLARAAVNVYYLVWLIYIPLKDGLTKANPHEVLFGYYFNFVIIAVYLVFATASFFIEHDR